MIGRLVLGGARTRIGRKTKRGLTLGKILRTDEKLFRQAATGVSGQNSRFWMDEHNADGSRISKRTAIRAQTPTGRSLKLFRTQHNLGIIVSLAVSLETNSGPCVRGASHQSVGRLLPGNVERPVT